MITIEKFVEGLSLEQENEECENFYKDENKRNNLRIYLVEMMKLKPEILFVGEAPGYLGCAVTGIPFTDERVLNEYKALPGDYITYGMKKERSAKAMWDVLRDIEKLPVLWNSFPLHPHKFGNIKSNRVPSNIEKQKIGEKYIKYIIDLFGIEEVYAVGLQAFNTLKEMKVSGFYADREKSYIRHPSYGGKEECQEKIRRIFEGR